MSSFQSKITKDIKKKAIYENQNQQQTKNKHMKPSYVGNLHMDSLY